MATTNQILTAQAKQDHQRYIMRLHETERACGFKRAHIYYLMNEGKFPKAKRVGKRAVGWDSWEVEQWVTDRLEERG